MLLPTPTRAAAFLESYFDIIFALNNLTHPGEKRMVQYAKEHATILPFRFEENLELLFESLFTEPDKAIRIIETMNFEIRDIIK